MRRTILATVFGCFIAALPLAVIKLPDSPLTDAVGYAAMLLALPGAWVGILATSKVDANFWIMVPANGVVYSLLAYWILKTRAKRRAAIEAVPQGAARK